VAGAPVGSARPHEAGSGPRPLAALRGNSAQPGASSFEIEADPHAEGFYLHMGALRIGEISSEMQGARRILPLLRMHL